jgi:hypothetical protein
MDHWEELGLDTRLTLQEDLGRLNLLFPFDTTRTAQEKGQNYVGTQTHAHTDISYLISVFSFVNIRKWDKHRGYDQVKVSTGIRWLRSETNGEGGCCELTN